MRKLSPREIFENRVRETSMTRLKSTGRKGQEGEVTENISLFETFLDIYYPP